MIIHTTGHSKNYPCDSPIAFDTKDVLYLHGYDKHGERTLVYLKHNCLNSDGSENIMHLLVDMSVKDIVDEMNK